MKQNQLQRNQIHQISSYLELCVESNYHSLIIIIRFAIKFVSCRSSQDHILPTGKDAAYKLLSLQRLFAATPSLRSLIYFLVICFKLGEAVLPSYQGGHFSEILYETIAGFPHFLTLKTSVSQDLPEILYKSSLLTHALSKATFDFPIKNTFFG